MARKRTTPSEGTHATADKLLQELAELGCSLRRIEGEISEAVEQIHQSYGGVLDKIKARIADREKTLRRLAKRHRDRFFKDRDRVDLAHGALLHSVERRVKRIKRMLKKLKENGLTSAIRVAESVNWDEVEKWPDDILALLGTERVKKERFEFELLEKKEQKTEGRLQRTANS